MNERSGGRARGRALRDQWLTTTAMATGLTVLAMLPNPALANCAATDSIIACSGTTASPGYGDGTQSGQTITVEAGATVLGGSAKTNAAMEIGADNTVNNGGSITGAIHGITATGNILVNNTAVIAATGAAPPARRGGTRPSCARGTTGRPRSCSAWGGGAPRTAGASGASSRSCSQVRGQRSGRVCSGSAGGGGPGRRVVWQEGSGSEPRAQALRWD